MIWYIDLKAHNFHPSEVLDITEDEKDHKELTEVREGLGEYLATGQDETADTKPSSMMNHTFNNPLLRLRCC